MKSLFRFVSALIVPVFLLLISSTSTASISAIATNGSFNCVLISTGTVKCWGYNGYGQLGDGSITNRLTPVPVNGLSGVTAITSGSSHACALLTSGAVKCWGRNNYGQLGDGTINNQLIPVTVSGLTNVQKIVSGGLHTCALTTSGVVKCWGYNGHGRLGDGTTTNRSTPVTVVTGLSNISMISAGGYHSCAANYSGMKCWGRNNYGQLGDATITDHSTPFSVNGLTNISHISNGDSHTCAQGLYGGYSKDYCWGYNAYGQLGNGNTNSSLTPVAVSNPNSTTSISAGWYHTCAVNSYTGYAYVDKCWGGNANGQVGNGNTTRQLLPVSVNGLISSKTIAASQNHSCAITAAGKVKCWGLNTSGQLGNNSLTTQLVPVNVVFPNDIDSDGFSEDEGDNCPAISNPDQLDSDNDKFGDVCDPDPNVYNFYGNYNLSLADRTVEPKWNFRIATVFFDEHGSEAWSETPSRDCSDEQQPCFSYRFVALLKSYMGGSETMAAYYDDYMEISASNNNGLSIVRFVDGWDGSDFFIFDKFTGNLIDLPAIYYGAFAESISLDENNIIRFATDDYDGTYSPAIQEFDGDLIAGASDNCLNAYNPDQLNTDGDSQGNACDLDDDNDNWTDLDESACGSNPIIASSKCIDTDGDNKSDGADNCPAISNSNQLNSDGDNFGDACDPDPSNPHEGYDYREDSYQLDAVDRSGTPVWTVFTQLTYWREAEYGGGYKTYEDVNNHYFREVISLFRQRAGEAPELIWGQADGVPDPCLWNMKRP